MVTTIKVPVGLRDRLKAGAAGRFATMAEYLEHLADLDRRQQRMAGLRADIAATPTGGRESWLDEAAQWEGAELADWPDRG
jgi:hypothetical protein